MNNLIEKTVNHLSKTAERIIPEKSMTDAEIEKLLSDTENAVRFGEGRDLQILLKLCRD